MGKLRDQMVSDLKLRNYSPKTVQAYTSCMNDFAKHFRRSPELMGQQEIRDFLLHLIEKRQASPALQKMFVAALKFFYRITLNRPEEVEKIPYPKIPDTLPDVLSRDEVVDILDAVVSLKYKAIIATTYAAGLRITEACSLKCRGDIDRDRMLIHVREGKGAKDRYVMLSEKLLLLLQLYWREARPRGIYLFPGQDPDQPISAASVYNVLRQAIEKTCITKHVTLHTFRHCFATHLLEDSTDLRIIQALLGHSSIKTTCRYTRVSADLIARTKSPFDSLSLNTEPQSAS